MPCNNYSEQEYLRPGNGEGTAMPKTMTLRLSDELAADLEAMARVDDVPVSEAVRVAIAERVERRRRDKAFQARLRRLLEENRRALERLAK
jgi:predicted transcriptional regulator